MNGPAERLRLSNLVKEFESDDGVFRAVDDVSLSIPEGEFVTLLGPSGCGKTTTLRMIAGFEEPTQGSIAVNGQEQVGVPPNKRPMAMVFQNYALFPHLSVFDNVAYGLRIKKLGGKQLWAAVDEALATMNLDGLADRDPHQLSGGQQQRVALARAMVMKPDVLLFDEPLSNLDAKLRGQMRIEIRALQRRLGITSIYVTHDQEEAMSLSDRIVIMNKGRIEQVGTPPEIYRRPASLFVADFIGRANFVSAAVVGDVTDDSSRVRALGQEAVVSSQTGMAQGDDATLLVRPESVRLNAVGTAGEPGKVLHSVYLGSHVEYTVQTAAGYLTSVVSDPDVAAVLPEGTQVSVGFDADRAFLLRS